jgi:hypothetical protein
MFIFVSSSLLILLSLLIWRIRDYIYNYDSLKNFSKGPTPLVVHGFDLAFMSRGEGLKYLLISMKIVGF